MTEALFCWTAIGEELDRTLDVELDRKKRFFFNTSQAVLAALSNTHV